MSDDAIMANDNDADHGDEPTSQTSAQDDAASRPRRHARAATGRFSPGQSGNPRGRPRKQPEPVFVMMMRVLGETVQLTRGGKLVEMSCSEAIFRSMCHSAMTDPRLAKEVFRLATAREAAVDAADMDARLAQSEAAFANFIARMQRQTQIELAAAGAADQDSSGANDNPPSDRGGVP